MVTEEGRRVRDRLVAGLFQPPPALAHLPADEQRRFRDVLLDVVSPAPPQ